MTIKEKFDSTDDLQFRQFVYDFYDADLSVEYDPNQWSQLEAICPTLTPDQLRIAELEQQLAELRQKAQVQVQPEPETVNLDPWKPEGRGAYYFTNDIGITERVFWDDDPMDTLYHQNINCHPTPEAANRAHRRAVVRAWLDQAAEKLGYKCISAYYHNGTLTLDLRDADGRDIALRYESSNDYKALIHELTTRTIDGVTFAEVLR